MPEICISTEVVPRVALIGEMLVMAALGLPPGTLNITPIELRFPTCTIRLPVTAPSGTVAVNNVALAAVKAPLIEMLSLPANIMLFREPSVLNPDPVMVTGMPGIPVLGLTPVTEIN